MTGLASLVRLGVGMLAGAAIAWPIAHWRGEAEGRATLQAELAQASAAAEAQRTQDDARLDDLSDRALCERSLHARGLPIGACAELDMPGVSGR